MIAIFLSDHQLTSLARAASMMLAAGVELKIVQETLGHVSSTFTRDTYTSVYPEAGAAAAEQTAALITTSTSAIPPDAAANTGAMTRHGRTSTSRRLKAIGNGPTAST